MIWLIGNRGMLGSDVEELLKKGRFPYTGTDAEVDIIEYDALREHAARHDPDWIINCSAYTAVDRAEDEQDRAFAVNAGGVLNVARVAEERGARLIHISTDYVFDGEKPGAYREDDATGPTGAYGLSKLEGERHVVAAMSDYFILRTAWLYGTTGGNFVRTMLRLFNERDEVRVVDDQWGSPTFTRDLAAAVIAIVKADARAFGIYHFTNEGRTNWYGFAREIYALGRRYGLIGREVRITPIPTAEYPTRARRPKNSYLSKDRIRSGLGIVCRGWEEALEGCIRALADAQRGTVS
jgi:dTDP-4-dehydrorhamnose reductase